MTSPTTGLLPLACIACVVAGCVATQMSTNSAERDPRDAVRASMQALSHSMKTDGGGPDAYEALLTEDFTRWNVRDDQLMSREELMDGIRQWWDAGGRVADSRMRVHEIAMQDGVAMTRLVVHEAYAEGSDSDSAVCQLWVHDRGRWLLRRANVHGLR